MYPNHAKAIKGMSIANIVLGILTILGGMGGCAAFGVGGAALAGYDYIPLDDGTYLDAAATAGILGVFSILMVLLVICGIVVLVAGIMGVRGADKPEKLKSVMVWNIVGAVVSFFGTGIISAVLCIIVAVFANKDKNAYAAGAAAAPYGAYGAYGAPVPPVAPVAPAAPQQPAVSNAPVVPTTPVAAEAVTPQQPAPAQVEAVAHEAEVAAEHAADPAIILPNDNIQDVDVASVVIEEPDSDKPQA